jgi:hypothetical protein
VDSRERVGGIIFSCLATSGPYQIIGDIDLELAYVERADHADIAGAELGDVDVLFWLFKAETKGRC